ncbi:MAG: ferritin family protein [Planctomycetes bacterium]|nr:ferritin family protein [Planctomycetota bacterium]
MEAEVTKLAEGLLAAIKAERDGHSFYSMAATSAQDQKAKGVFAQLAAEELEHMNFLTQHYESVLKSGRPDQTARLGPRADFGGLSPIFSDGVRTRIKGAHFEMSALSIGMQLEADAVKFYQAQSAAARDAAVKKFFNELAEWESGHYQALRSQQELLKEDYWAAGGFAPF